MSRLQLCFSSLAAGFPVLLLFVVVFPTSLDCYRFVFTILELFTRSNDVFEGLSTFGLIGTICIFLFCPDRLVCLNKSINASLLLNIHKEGDNNKIVIHQPTEVSPFWEKNYALRLEKDPRVAQEKVNEELYR